VPVHEVRMCQSMLSNKIIIEESTGLLIWWPGKLNFIVGLEVKRSRSKKFLRDYKILILLSQLTD